MTKSNFTNFEHFRNVGISAHIDSGKTTLTERMLYYGGRIHQMREVRGGDGGATMDSDPIEKRRGITIASAATSIDWQDHHINVIDTPGHVDFTVEVERSLRVLDGAVLVLCAVGGVQSQTMTVDRQMRRYGIPRIALVNKMDRTGADPDRVIGQLRDHIDANPIALQIPIGLGEAFAGVIDLVTMQAVYFDGEDGSVVRRAAIEPNLQSAAKEARLAMVEALAMLDESVMDSLFAGKDPSVDELRRVIRCATLARTMTPVLLASAYKNKGIQEVLDAIVRYLPAPQEREIQAYEVVKKDAQPERITLATDIGAQAVVMAFKTVVEEFGQLTFLRIYQGTISKGDTLKNVRTGRSIRLGRLVRMHSNERQDIDLAIAGDIVAGFGVDCASGDTLVGRGPDLLLENIVVAAPVVSLSIAPETRDGIDRLGKALDRFRREDPTFHVATDSETGETKIAGMGQLHLEVYVERLREEYRCPCIAGRPSVTYRERPTETVEFEHRLKKQNGGNGVFAQIKGRMEPLPRDAKESFVFEDQITGGRLTPAFIKAARVGFVDALDSGPIHGYQMVGVRLTLTDGMLHDKDSSELAFRTCAAEAMRRVVMPRCHAELLEPMMDLEIEVPSEFQGGVTGNLGQLRGVVTDSAVEGDRCTLKAIAPLAELFDYANNLRSMTQGKGSFTMQPNGYRPVPKAVLATLKRSAV